MKLNYYFTLLSSSLLLLFSFTNSNLWQHNIYPNSTNIFVDTIPPTAKCRPDTTKFPLPVTGCVTIHAKNLDGGSFDNITPADKLLFYFNGDRQKDTIQICCEDFVGAGVCDELFVELQLWVEDEDGNKSYCTAKVLVQNNQDVCPFSCIHYRISGNINDIHNDIVTTIVTLTDSNKLIKKLNGSSFLFGDLNNGLYNLCLERNDDYTNGVTTADIVKIRRHILGIESLNSPYKLMAADVTRSHTITAADISEIRRLLLGVKSEFSNVPSWIFVPKNRMFTANIIPDINLFIPSCNTIQIKDQSIDNIDFIAVKMGDVTLDAMGHLTKKNQSRAQFIELNYQVKLIENEHQSTLFHINKNIDLAGLQFTLSFNPSEFEFVKIQNGQINLEEEQYSLHDLQNGKINIAWDKNPLDKTSSTSGTLFSIIWKKKSAVNSDFILNFDPHGVQPLIIDNNLNEFDLSLQSENQFPITKIEAYPNFKNHLIQIVGQISRESMINYSIIDITGRIVYQKSILYDQGLLNESIPVSALPPNAMYFLKIKSDQFSRSWKFINLN